VLYYAERKQQVWQGSEAEARESRQCSLVVGGGSSQWGNIGRKRNMKKRRQIILLSKFNFNVAWE
jgi:hypothetical protein